MGLKCQKYSNIQIYKKSLSQNQDLLNSDTEDNDFESLLSKKDGDNNQNLIIKKKGKFSDIKKKIFSKIKNLKIYYILLLQYIVF